MPVNRLQHALVPNFLQLCLLAGVACNCLSGCTSRHPEAEVSELAVSPDLPVPQQSQVQSTQPDAEQPERTPSPLQSSPGASVDGGADGRTKVPPNAQTLPRNSTALRAATLPLAAAIPESGSELIRECLAVAEHLANAGPQSIDALEMRARAEYEFGEVLQAKQLWTRMLEMNPNYAFALTGLGNIALDEGEFQQACEYHRRAVEILPNSADQQLLLAKALVSANRLPDAEITLQKLTQQFPDFTEAFVQLGAVALLLEKLPTAEAAYRKAIELDAESMKAHFGLIAVARRQGRLEDAKRHQNVYSELRKKQSQSSDTAEAYDDVEALAIDIAKLFVDMARVYVGLGQNQTGEMLLSRASQMAKTNIESRQALAWLATQRSEPLEAVRWLSEIKELTPHDFSYVLEIARLYAAAGMQDQAKEVLEEFVERNPRAPAALEAVAKFQQEVAPGSDRSLELARQAVELAPTLSRYMLLATIYEDRNEFDNALETLALAQKMVPSDAAVAARIARLQEHRELVESPTGER
ncbi:tetratricopeptide repeat protein [Aureliella helgolandensis]|uniref:Tetratricopeptide repeat protein n=1 Tax=Aureliella helgolandensis TaxID=2527968 RepID=A0A518G9V9_9BACT|nr:tetratricopeptide repeat protein [Aureliella helgolandensis]QDV25371.1 tetratricopeptide repeat protein [Aureliella helgolandensis]